MEETKELKWKDHWPDFEFEELVSMYINDCMQYLDSPVDLTKEKFDKTRDQDKLYDGLRELKDACMCKAI